MKNKTANNRSGPSGRARKPIIFNPKIDNIAAKNNNGF